MKLLGWQRTAGILVKVIGIVGVTSATAFAVPVVATITVGSSSASELLSKRLHRDTNAPADAFPVNSLDYILGDSIFGSLMFAGTSHAGTDHIGPRRNANITDTPTALPC